MNRPNRIVIETEEHSYVSCIRAERPDETVIIVLAGDETEVYGGPDGQPVEPLAAGTEEVEE